MSTFYLAWAQFVAFFVITLNLRYCAKGRIALTVFTDVLISINGFFLIKLVGNATTAIELIGYAAGGGLGSYAAMRLTKGLKDHGK